MISEKVLREAVASSRSFSEVMVKIGIRYRSGSAWANTKSRVKRLGIDYSHFLGKSHRRGTPSPKKPASDTLKNDPDRVYRESARILRRASFASSIASDLRRMGSRSRCGSTAQESFPARFAAGETRRVAGKATLATTLPNRSRFFV